MANTYRFRTQTYQIVREPEGQGYNPCTSPSAAVSILRAILARLDNTQEHFLVVCLDSRGRVVGHKILSSGLETSCLVDPSMVFRAALVLGGISVIACHNHPSGGCDPSREDKALTLRLRQAGEIIGISLSDHIILGETNHHSFRAYECWDALPFSEVSR